MCDECSLQFRSPQDALEEKDGFRKSWSPLEQLYRQPYISAILDEIEQAGWTGFIEGEIFG